MITTAWLDDDGQRRPFANLAPLAVDPTHQREGVGSALMRAVIAEAEARGEPLIVLQGHPGYYPRFGFEWSVPLGITMDLPDWAPREAAQVLKLEGYDPAIKGQVVYPPAFDESGAVGAEGRSPLAIPWRRGDFEEQKRLAAACHSGASGISRCAKGGALMRTLTSTLNSEVRA